MRLAVVIPVLDEAEALPALLERLEPMRARGTEIVIADGGSRDESIAIARRAGLSVVDAPRGRARQMNAGASAAAGDALWFLHADTAPPPNADAIVETALIDGRHAWGRFDVTITGRSPVLRLVAGLMNLRSRLTGIATGDQALFTTRRAFDAVGGFPDQPLMEDIEICRRLKRVSPPKCLRERVTTSGRRWETRGLWATIFLMWRLRWAYWLGTRPETLAGRYR